MVSIYFAAPLHNKEDQDKNAEQVALLRKNGYTVYSPYEHGVWEDLVEKLGGEKQCREYLYKQDIYAMRRADVCIAYQYRDKGPSEGQLWEMGWFRGMNKHVVLVNENNWRFNLMPQFGADMVFSTMQEAIDYMNSELFA